MAAGYAHSLAIKRDGTVWGFGYNSDGELGDGTTTHRSLPVPTIGPTKAVKIGAGWSSSFALTADGVVWAWGLNGEGELADGTPFNRPTPVSLSESGFNWKVGTPVFSLASGTYRSAQTVTIRTLTPGGILHYTTNGAVPTEADAVVPVGGAVTVAQSGTLTARGWKSGMAPSNISSATYVLKVPDPTVSLDLLQQRLLASPTHFRHGCTGCRGRRRDLTDPDQRGLSLRGRRTE